MKSFCPRRAGATALALFGALALSPPDGRAAQITWALEGVATVNDQFLTGSFTTNGFGGLLTYSVTLVGPPVGPYIFSNTIADAIVNPGPQTYEVENFGGSEVTWTFSLPLIGGLQTGTTDFIRSMSFFCTPCGDYSTSGTTGFAVSTSGSLADANFHSAVDDLFTVSQSNSTATSSNQQLELMLAESAINNAQQLPSKELLDAQDIVDIYLALFNNLLDEALNELIAPGVPLTIINPTGPTNPTVSQFAASVAIYYLFSYGFSVDILTSQLGSLAVGDEIVLSAPNTNDFEILNVSSIANDGTVTFGAEGIASAVPEPSSLLLLGVGLGLLGLASAATFRRRSSE